MINSIDISSSNEIPYNIIKDNLEESLQKIVNMIKKFDIDIQKISIEREIKQQIDPFMPIPVKGHPVSISNIDNKNILVEYLNSYHYDIYKNEIKFNFYQEESNGTKILFSLMGLILHSLRNGKVLIIDELDKSLHPFLIIKIIEMFKDIDYNKKNAQLIFTCHNGDILSKEFFSKYEVSFLEKNLKSGTKIMRLSEFKNEDIKDDWRKLYWDGVFGSIPFPYI